MLARAQAVGNDEVAADELEALEPVDDMRNKEHTRETQSRMHAHTVHATNNQPTNHWERKEIPPSLAPPTTPPPPRKSDENDGGDRQFQAAKTRGSAAPNPTRVWGVRFLSGGWAEALSDVWPSTVAYGI